MRGIVVAAVLAAGIALAGISNASAIPSGGAALGKLAALEGLKQDARYLRRHCVRYRHGRYWGPWHCGRWH